MAADLAVYIINLDRSPERWAAMEAEMARVGLTARRVSALDARRDADVMRQTRPFPKPDGEMIFEMGYEGKPYRLSEEACFQSHLKALGLFLKDGGPAALILEDDAEFAPDATAAIDAILAIPGAWDAVRLEGLRTHGRRPAIHIADLPGERMLVASMRPVWGSAAYLISRAGAEKLLARGRRLETYDGYLGALAAHGLRFLDCAPFPIRQAAGPSTIVHDAAPRAPLRQRRWFAAWWRHVRADQMRQIPRWTLFPVKYWRRALRWTMAPWYRAW